jgi:hypothetical protein
LDYRRSRAISAPNASVRQAHEYEHVAIPAVVFVACFAGGVIAASQWLPDIAGGPVGTIAYFAVCGLLGAGLGIVGLHVYLTAEAIKRDSGLPLEDRGTILASGLLQILLDGGTVFGLAIVAYLLSPRDGEHHEPPRMKSADL